MTDDVDLDEYVRAIQQAKDEAHLKAVLNRLYEEGFDDVVNVDNREKLRMLSR